MNQHLKNKLIRQYRKAFQNTYEMGGGYGFRFYHGLRVMKYCEKFLELDYFKKKDVNIDALLIAALFHDIGKVKAVDEHGEIQYLSIANKKHDVIGAKVIADYINNYIKDQSTLEKIQNIIYEQYGEQTSIESKMVKDADRLDNYGFIQIWRHITHAHQNKRNLDQVIDYWFNQDGRSSAKNYLKKIHFPTIRKLAKKRFQKLDFLISEIKKEFEVYNLE